MTWKRVELFPNINGFSVIHVFYCNSRTHKKFPHKLVWQLFLFAKLLTYQQCYKQNCAKFINLDTAL